MYICLIGRHTEKALTDGILLASTCERLAKDLDDEFFEVADKGSLFGSGALGTLTLGWNADGHGSLFGRP